MGLNIVASGKEPKAMCLTVAEWGICVCLSGNLSGVGWGKVVKLHIAESVKRV